MISQCVPRSVQFSSVQSLSHVWLFATPWITARQASLSITNSWSLLKLMSIKSVMPSNHLIISRPLLLLPSIFPSIRVVSSESVLCISWPKYWSFSFCISPSNKHSGHGKADWFQIGKGVRQGCILSPCLFNLHAEYIMRNMGWKKHKLESRLPGEISITSDMQMTPHLWQKVKRN